MSDTGLLDDARTLRNAVAHRSVSSLNKARNRTRTRLGVIAADANVAEMILSRDIVTAKSLYDSISEYFDEVARYVVR